MSTSHSYTTGEASRRHLWLCHKRSIAMLASLFLFAAGAFPLRAAADDNALADLSIKELMSIEVTSASKKAQKLSEIPAAVFVITNEDIRRSGARNIPEALRLAPGVDVAFIGGGRYAATIRGFNSRFANKLLVLVDGRSIYTPLFSGVMWEGQGPVLEDVERIEIIRGPGAAVWGANAVNGVINIIMRHSKDTQGVLVSSGTGTLDRGFATLQYGDNVRGHDGLTYRVFGKAETHAEGDTESDAHGNDAWHGGRTGFRIDQEQQEGRLSLQGEAYHMSSGDTIGMPLLVAPYSTLQNVRQLNSGGDLLARWDRTLTSSQDITLQTYYDFSVLTLPHVANTQLKNLDIEFSHRLRVIPRNDITWGLDYRMYGDRVDGKDVVSFTPSSATLRISSVFAQDEIALVPDRLRLTLGGKMERDSFTGSHFMPDARVLWDIDSANQAWMSVERAFRTPSFGEESSSFRYNQVIPPFPPFLLIPIQPVEVPNQFGAEKLTAYEIGYRTQLAKSFSLDATMFVNHYSNLRSVFIDIRHSSVETLDGIRYIRLPIPVNNDFSGQEAGVELAADWRVLDNWRLQASFSKSRFKMSERDLDGSFDASPRGLLSLRSSVDALGTQFDLWVRHVGQRVATFSTPEVNEYTTLDAALSWRLPHGFDVGIVGKDLRNSRHLEFVSNFISSQPIEVERSAYVRVTWTY